MKSVISTILKRYWEKKTKSLKRLLLSRVLERAMDLAYNFDSIVKKGLSNLDLKKVVWFFKVPIITILVLISTLFVPQTIFWNRYDLHIRDQSYKKESKVYPRMKRYMFDIVYEESYLSKIDHRIVLAIINAESRFERRAVSSSGAVGYMQIMPFNYGGPTKNLFRTKTNIRVGVRLLKRYIDIAKGNMIIALKNYNSGPASDYYNISYIVKIVGEYNPGLSPSK